MAFELPDLPYDYDALEPHIDGRTMEIHYNKHHNAYLTKFKAAVDNTPLADQKLEDILAKAGQHGDAVRNQGGGYYNHIVYWDSMSPSGGGKPDGKLASAIDDSFGSFDEFKDQFTTAATGLFGSGFVWLVPTGGKLEIVKTPNQDNPLMDVAPVQGTPLMGLDVWEHAFYLKYQNRKPEYVEAWWNVVNWDGIARKFEQVG
ncbi:MAG: superoxide dismutase [Salinisphaeraceae bacterium]|uniref:Superoxide dismutase n=1 Tax=Spectribacter hydrogenoxidans TaxID=3075608 RepID=A0ABU3BXJ6_9GAMM|nr:superoxide dismutase [Salinisphaera sp. W335]MDT0634031.1 superoxide dismutase [Salinisphaera sp. W335]